MPRTRTTPICNIRWMIRRDLPDVLAIEQASDPAPWCEEEFLRVLRQRNCIGMVAEADDRVLGFMIYTLHKSHLQVSKFAVTPEARRRGVGRQMMAKLVGKLGERRHRILINVPLSERCDGPMFLKAMGFIATAVFSDTPEPGIDTLEFVLRRDWIDS
ncbi:GNAT family N-acetyltransferase [Tautonia sp. JC769]|uniref:GNAT family N-acetyltransferase n=1 Tax=Tautonia sp. JC769 TaxID=3232135 RepID=UPI0034597BD0